MKYICKNHPDRIAAVDTGIMGESCLLCWDCYYDELRKRQEKYGTKLTSKVLSESMAIKGKQRH